ncbi:brain-specific angiogenesis inhibitor 1-associated protein 2-like isoform X2 [Dreissena polymorpha]|nr:brain-specific angiogenesis inhibitor 1-associated protein 2-like isoform X2 [Dreissena polymorpha]
MEKDFKKASSDVRKYSQGHKLVMSPFIKAYDTLKKFRKKTKNKPVYDSEKEANHMRSLGKCQEKLDEYRIQGLRSALLEERRCHCFVLQRLCSVAHLDYGVHRQGVDVYVSLRDWEDVCSNPHQLPPSADRVIADFMDDYQPMNGGTEYHGNGHGYLHRDTQSLHNGLRRSKSSQELSWNRGRLDGTQTLPHSMSPPPAPQGRVQATYNFTATQENQMSFTDGDIIVLMGEKSEGWQYGHNMNTHRMGWFPLSFTKPLTSGRSSPDFKALSPSNRTQSVGDMLDVHPPPPPDHLQYDPGLPGNMRRPNSLYDCPPQTNSSPQLHGMYSERNVSLQRSGSFFSMGGRAVQDSAPSAPSFNQGANNTFSSDPQTPPNYSLPSASAGAPYESKAQHLHPRSYTLPAKTSSVPCMMPPVTSAPSPAPPISAPPPPPPPPPPVHSQPVSSHQSQSSPQHIPSPLHRPATTSSMPPPPPAPSIGSHGHPNVSSMSLFTQRQPSTRVNAVNTPVRQLSNNPPPPPLQDHATIEENVNHQNNPMFASVSLRKAQTNDRSAPKF